MGRLLTSTGIEGIVNIPAYQRYPSDLNGNGRVRRMSPHAKAFFGLLLDEIWEYDDTQCRIPDDDELISRLLGLSSKEWLKYRREIFAEGAALLDVEGGFIVCERHREQKDKIVRYKKAQAENGRASGRARRKKADQRTNHGSTTVQPAFEPEPNQKRTKDEPEPSREGNQNRTRDELSLISSSLNSNSLNPTQDSVELDVDKAAEKTVRELLRLFNRGYDPTANHSDFDVVRLLYEKFPEKQISLAYERLVENKAKGVRIQSPVKYLEKLTESGASPKVTTLETGLSPEEKLERELTEHSRLIVQRLHIGREYEEKCRDVIQGKNTRDLDRAVVGVLAEWQSLDGDEGIWNRFEELLEPETASQEVS